MVETPMTVVPQASRRQPRTTRKRTARHVNTVKRKAKRSGLACNFRQNINYAVRIKYEETRPRRTQLPELEKLFTRVWREFEDKLPHYEAAFDNPRAWLFTHIYRRICTLCDRLSNVELYTRLQHKYHMGSVPEPAIRKTAVERRKGPPRKIATGQMKISRSSLPAFGNLSFTCGVEIDGGFFIFSNIVPQPPTDNTPIVVTDEM